MDHRRDKTGVGAEPCRCASIGALRTSDLDYDLPHELIATHPAARRDAARMMVLRTGQEHAQHGTVHDLPKYLRPGDLLVINQTRVVPARIIGHRSDSGGRVEGLFLRTIGDNRWSMFLRSNGKLRIGHRIELLDRAMAPSGIRLELIAAPSVHGDETWQVRIETDADVTGDRTLQILDTVGRTPLPPYILKARRQTTAVPEPVPDDQDRSMYQTIYATEPGSVAAPTAGLHFTHELLNSLGDSEITIARLTLHVGAGTFRPITAEYVQQHVMHREWYTVPSETLDAIRQTRRGGGRIIAVGTTSVRCLESLGWDGRSACHVQAAGGVSGTTDLLIAPGYRFRLIDGMLTNFHLPRSTLLSLVGAYAGLDRLLAAYRTAVRMGYRFYSYGDCMLLIPSSANTTDGAETPRC